MPVRAMFLTARTTVVDEGSRWPTPADALTGGLTGLLARVARMVDGEGVLMLGGATAHELGLPVTPDELADAASHPAAVAARAAGWKVSRISDWSTFTADDRPTIRLCITPLVDTAQCPLWADTPEETLATFGLWHELTGSAYHGALSMAGLSILSELSPRGAGSPTWKHKGRPPYEDTAFEDDYHIDHWRAAPSGMMYAHGLDANRAYIGSAANVYVAKTMLKPGPKTFVRERDQHLGGWILAELPTWNDPRLPDPAGYPDEKGVRVRPISIPTMVLLDELAEAGRYGAVRVIESWVAPGVQLLQPWAWRMRDAYAGRIVAPKAGTGRLIFDRHPPARVARVQEALKLVGRAVLGSFNSPDNWVYRPDWWYSVIAMDRCNRWRKMDKTARQHDRWPGWIDVDNVWYPSDEPDWRKAAPPERLADGTVGWPIDESGVKLGHFKHKGTKVSKKRRKAA